MQTPETGLEKKPSGDTFRIWLKMTSRNPLESEVEACRATTLFGLCSNRPTSSAIQTQFREVIFDHILRALVEANRRFSRISLESADRRRSE